MSSDVGSEIAVSTYARTMRNAEFRERRKAVTFLTGSYLHSATCTRSAQKFRRSASAS